MFYVFSPKDNSFLNFLINFSCTFLYFKLYIGDSNTCDFSFLLGSPQTWTLMNKIQISHPVFNLVSFPDCVSISRCACPHPPFAFFLSPCSHYTFFFLWLSVFFLLYILPCVTSNLAPFPSAPLANLGCRRTLQRIMEKMGERTARWEQEAL